MAEWLRTQVLKPDCLGSLLVLPLTSYAIEHHKQTGPGSLFVPMGLRLP